ncbi:MAG TPA: peptidase T [Candidatus Faecivicinus avistercoris]|nr:peptidase T [Candidatus Faecivicinus avistercoris]
MRAYERLLRYAQYDTASDERSETCPSTEKQRVLAEALAAEMREMGMTGVRVDENGYVYGCVPATAEKRPVIGLIAHMDTVDCVPVAPVRARIVENYDGGAVRLENGDLLDPKVFPDIAKAKGKDLIVTDGNTLLGADDKAGVAEILTACERLLADRTIPHGKVMVGFTPDEEIGRGADRFDIPGFGADFAYTVDGGAVGSIEYENFNAAAGNVVVHGLSVHPGSAKNKMRNASLVAMEFAAMLPPAETPAHTEGFEGFFHLCSMEGTEELAKLEYIIRDHDRAKFASRKAAFERIGRYLNDKYGEGTVEVDVRDSYSNMREVIEPHMHIIRLAERAYREAGIEPFSEAIRGGTDGARLSYMGLPCPNLATGGMNCHGRFECVAIQDMDAMVDVLVRLVSIDPE